MEYQILTGPTHTQLAHSVAVAIKNGWRPLGGLATLATKVNPYDDPDEAGTLTIYLYQAMIKGE